MAVAEIHNFRLVWTVRSIAALLHDVIEDTEYGYDYVKSEFGGKSVADLVDSV